MDQNNPNNLAQIVTKLQRDIQDLQAQITRNNFTGHQDFNKSVSFNSKLKVPHYSSLPTTAETGEICEVSGKLYIASATNTWSLVGTQT